MGTISSSYTTHEQIELPTYYAEHTEDLNGDPTTPAAVNLASDAAADQKVVIVASGEGSKFFVGQHVLLKDGTDEETNQITAIATDTLTMKNALANTYTAVTGTATPLDKGWKVRIELKNTGSRDATIDDIFLNDKPLKDYPTGSIILFKADDSVAGNDVPVSDISLHVAKGTDQKLIIWIQQGVEGCNHGVTINLKLHSAQGYTYPLSVKLP